MFRLLSTSPPLDDVSSKLADRYVALRDLEDEGGASMIVAMSGISEAQRLYLMELRIRQHQFTYRCRRRLFIFQWMEGVHSVCSAVVPILIPLSKAYEHQSVEIHNPFGKQYAITTWGTMLTLFATVLSLVAATMITLERAYKFKEHVLMSYRQCDMQAHEFALYLSMAGPEYKDATPAEAYALFIERYNELSLKHGMSSLFAFVYKEDARFRQAAPFTLLPMSMSSAAPSTATRATPNVSRMDSAP
eukprot:TRINITY_DN77903_c0_g1_i1.p1 TRINITY_DN77903_c0_g1~~TRINITY_DN77903_c0_g1_i1.p1  ORF type:complete len:247 (+),score=41.03 TRINITY_DN77903_c0_g1_i1:109-849(+)